MSRRPHVSNTSWVASVLRRHNTLHIDAWLLEDEHGVLWLRVLSSKGGVRILKEDWLQVSLTGTPPLWRVPDIHRYPDIRTCTERHLRSRWSLADGGWRDDRLNELHWNAVQPLLSVLPEGFKWQSIALHYVRAASLDPLEGFENWMTYGKGGHRGPSSTRAPKPSVTSRFDALDAIPYAKDDRPLAGLAGLLD